MVNIKGNLLEFNVCYSYNLDLVNLLNVLTAEEIYVRQHSTIFTLFGERLSEESKGCIEKAVLINESAMLGPLLSLVISAVPDFEQRSIVGMFADTDLLHTNLKRFS